MEYRLFPPFFGIEPQTSFDEAWEVFCCELLKLEYNTHLIQRRTPRDLGADLIWDEKKIIYQCKSSIDGQSGSFSTDKAVRSINRALENRERIGWQKYVLCTNVNLTGEAWAKLKAKLPEIEILSGGYWVDLCEKFCQEKAVKTRFRYLSVTIPERIWSIPPDFDIPFFTGREKILDQIHKNLNAGKTTALTQPQAINGLGGIGKTQCAVEYARLHRKEYRYVLWVNASTPETLTTSYKEIASRLDLPEKNESEEKTVGAVKQWLHVHDNWLLIVDNVEDLINTFNLLPSANTGHILLTTREQAVGKFAQSIKVEEMEEEEGILMLLRRAGKLAHDAPIEQANPQDRDQARTIVREMDGLPLALEQVGAYIEENKSSLEEYLETYKRRQADLLKWLGRYGTKSVATTWSLNFEKVEQSSPLAADVMRVCAFLAPDDIPEELFKRKASKPGSALRALANEPTLLQEAVGALNRFSLVKRNPDQHTLSIHRLVQVVVKNDLKKNQQKKWTNWVVYALRAAFPSSLDIASWEVCQQYLPHTLVCFDLIQQYNVTSVEAALLLQNVANYQAARASYGSFKQDDAVDENVEQMYRYALKVVEQYDAHRNTLINVIYDFAVFCYNHESYVQAELLLQKAVTINEQDVVEFNIARNYNLFASCYYKQGNYEQAEEFLQHARVIHEHSHLSTAMILNNLAALYYEQGQDEQRKKEKELEDYELGKDEQEEHEPGEDELEEQESEEDEPEDYEQEEHEPGKYEQAEMLYQRALAIHEDSPEPDHPNTAMILNNLAALYYVQGNQGKYIQKYIQRKYEQAETHVAMWYWKFATSKHIQEKYKQAETHLQRALDIYESSPSPNHFDTAMCLNNLAVLYYAQEKYDLAETRYQRALTICGQLLDSDHSTTLVSMNYEGLQMHVPFIL